MKVVVVVFFYVLGQTSLDSWDPNNCALELLLFTQFLDPERRDYSRHVGSLSVSEDG